jgi:hypothetical protein
MEKNLYFQQTGVSVDAIAYSLISFCGCFPKPVGGKLKYIFEDERQLLSSKLL